MLRYDPDIVVRHRQLDAMLQTDRVLALGKLGHKESQRAEDLRRLIKAYDDEQQQNIEAAARRRADADRKASKEAFRLWLFLSVSYFAALFIWSAL